MNDKDKGAGDKKPKGLIVKIGEEEKVFSSEDVSKLIEQTNALNQKVQGLSAVTKALDRYDTDAETYIQQSEGSFATVSRLMEQGVIDDKGNVIALKEKEPEPKDKGRPFNLDHLTKPTDVEKRTADIVQKALEPLGEALKKIQTTQGRLVETNLRSQVKGKFENLNDDDISRVFDTAYRDGSKDLLQHAEDASTAKGTLEKTMRARHAEEFGINLEDFEQQQKLKSESGDQNVLENFVKNKNLSFRPAKDDENAVDPIVATKEFFANQTE